MIQIRYVLALSVILLLWGFVSDMDYEEELRKACAGKGGELENHMCIVRKEKGKQND